MFEKVLDQFKLPIMLALLGLVVGLGMYHMVRVSLLENALEDSQAKVGKLTTENGILRAANKECSIKVDIQNKEVERLKREAAEASARAAAAMEQVRKDAEKWKRRYSDLLQAPPPSTDECAAAGSMLQRYRVIRDEEKGVSK